jgi:tetratricopeptide (TPR) repeat protein
MPDIMSVEEVFADLNEGLAAVRATLERQGLDAALRLLVRLREQFPQSLAPTHQANALLLEAGRLDEADAWLGEARNRFPHDIGLASHYARLAQRRRDTDEAVRRWQAVRDQFPDDPAGHICLATALREYGRFEASESAAAAGLLRFPNDPTLLVEYAFAAHMRLDWATAADRWKAARTQQPDHNIGYVLGAQCLRNLGQVDAAEAVLRTAIERFPDNAASLVEFAWTAHVRRDWTAAMDRWDAVAARFPNEVARYTGAGQALRELKRFDEAEALLTEAVTRYPNEIGPLIEYGGLAHHRRDWPEAVRRWARLRERHPQYPGGYQASASALREAGQLDEAEALLAAAVPRFPTHLAMLLEHGLTAQARLDWPAAVQRWERVRQVTPDNVTAYTGGALALRELGQPDAAEALLQDAIQRLADAQQPFLDYAEMATKRGDWDIALQRLTDAKQRFPNDARILKALHEAQYRVGPGAADLAAAHESPQAIEADGDMREIVSMFASLGGEPRGCEFGEVQRSYGAEPLDLLRWTHSPPEGLIAALECRFEGVGEPEQTEVFPHQTGDQWLYQVRDLRFQMGTHTYVAVDEAPQDKVAAQTCRRMQFLRRKLIEDLEAANKIFVYRTVMRNLDDDEVTRLHDAVRSYNKDTTLLYLRYTDDAHPDGTVEVARAGLLIGYFDRFGALPSTHLVDIPFATWDTVCREAYRLWRSGATRMQEHPLDQATTTNAEPTGDVTPDDATMDLAQDEPEAIFDAAATAASEEPPRAEWRRIVGSIFRRRT